MEKEIKSALKECPLFSGCDLDEAWQELCKAGGYREKFSPKDMISCRYENTERIGICISGRAAVYSIGHETTLLNRLYPGSLLGVATLFSDKNADTQVLAETEAEFLFLDRTGIDTLLEHKRIRRNLIGFLAGRIRFLTEKISSFTAPSAEGKLARYLLQHTEETVLFPPSVPLRNWRAF